MEKEYSAIDIIYNLYEKFESFEKRLQAIDDNIKILNNKVTKINKVGNQLVEHKPTAMPANPVVQEDLVQDIKVGTPEKLVLGSVKVFGYIVNRMKEPVQDVVINIYDNENKLIKSAKSNGDGYWDFRLPSGSYSMQYIHSKFKPINRTIKIPENVKEFEVR